MTNGVCELLWLQWILGELHLSINLPMKLSYDNKAVIGIIHNSVQHDHTKYMEVDWHFIKEKLEAGVICIPFVPTSQQIADLLIKRLSSHLFNFFIDKLGLLDIYAPIWGEVLEDEWLSHRIKLKKDRIKIESSTTTKGQL